MSSRDETTLLQITRFWEGVTLYGILILNGLALQEVYANEGFESSTFGFAFGLIVALLASWVAMYSAREAQAGPTRFHSTLYCGAHFLGGVSIGAFGMALSYAVGWI